MTPLQAFAGGFLIGFALAGALFYRAKRFFDKELASMNQEVSKAWNQGTRE